jgi:hypothetical protein
MSKIQALDAYKVSIVLKGVSCSTITTFFFLTTKIFQKRQLYVTIYLMCFQMNEKLEYLDKLKNNMGEEMAEVMSEEITKVMDEQRDIE